MEYKIIRGLIRGDIGMYGGAFSNAIMWLDSNEVKSWLSSWHKEASGVRNIRKFDEKFDSTNWNLQDAKMREKDEATIGYFPFFIVLYT